MSFVLPLAAAHGDLLLSAGGTTIEVDSARAWTLRTISHDGAVYADAWQSGQGTVVKEDGVWAGSIHLNEQLLDATLTVDDRPVSLDGLDQAAGERIVLTRTTELGTVFRLTSTMAVTDGQLEESISLTRLNPEPRVNVAYGFLATRNNRLTEVRTYDESGSVLGVHAADSDDDSSISLGGAVTVGLFDPERGDGIVSTLYAEAALGTEQFVWDRPFDNKLYVRLRALEGTGAAGDTFTARQVTLLGYEHAIPNPEPASAAMLALTGAALLYRRRHRSG